MIWKPHVTVAAVAEENGRFLLVEEDIAGARVLNQPAGHLEPDESLLQAVCRETLEETAWRFIPEALIGIYRWQSPQDGHTFLRFTFAGHCDQHDSSRVLDQEIIRALWLTPDAVRDQQAMLRSPLVLRAIEDYLAGVRYPLSLLIDIENAC
jgi:8-oxo-dGTP pyrophosphatase MutT (NUDIX family)